MKPLFRLCRLRQGALVSLVASLLLAGCSAGAAAEAPKAYYGGEARMAEAAPAPPMAEPMGGAMPGAAPAPMAPQIEEHVRSLSVSGSDDSGSDAWGGSDSDEESMAPAPAAPPPAAAGGMAPAARAPMAAPPQPQRTPPPPPPAGANKGAPPPPAGGKKAEGPSDQAAAKPVAPLLIYTGGLGMEVPDQPAIAPTIDKIIDLAEGMGGYLGGRTDTSVTIRVPSARFRDALTAIEKLGDVKRRNVSAQDVSEEYHDLEVRLGNLKSVQKRLQEFLARAQNINDALQVERELERIGREIDQIEGRMRFLRARATFSTITVDLAAKPKQQVIVQGGGNIPPPPRGIDLPIDWLGRVGLESLMTLR
jgi:hypothetical protein